MKESIHKQSPLYTHGTQKEVEPNSTESISFKVGHQESNSEKYHHMNILKYCKKYNLSNLKYLGLT